MLRSTLFVLFTLVAAQLIAQETPTETTAALDELLSTPISTAAKYDQRMSDIPASVTVITAEEIARYGWHTLAEVLAAVRGVYTNYDRGYTYLGVRGLSLSSDYNSRFIVLLDGHPMVESVSGSIGIGTALAIDLSSLARIEFVRGPSSVVYGTGAMFGVINLIPKDEGDRGTVMLGGGSHGLQVGSARAGIARGELTASVTASWQESAGRDLYFREFDSPATNNGIVRDRDFDDYHSVMGTLGWRDLKMIALQSNRTKGVPTASWGTAFGDAEQTTDQRTLFGVRFNHRLTAESQLTLAGHFDRFRYFGRYPYGPFFTFRDESRSTRAALEGQYIRDLRPNHRLTIGVSANRALRSAYRYGGEGDQVTKNEPFTLSSLFAQSEWQPLRTLSITAGGSFDSYSNLSGVRFTPRGAVVVHPNEHSTWKLLYGEGFRVPSVYEMDFERDATESLQPESIATTELIFERRLTPDMLITTSVFDIRMHDTLRQTFSGPASPTGYINAGEVHARGAELQLDYRRSDGIWSYLSVSRQRAREADQRMPNSPSQLVKAGISTPTANRLQGALELQYGSARETLGGAKVGNALLANLNVTTALSRHLSIDVAVRNVFDKDYALPGGPEHTQDSLVQDGRTVLVRIVARGK